MSTQPQVNVRVQKRFEASPERVFDAWLDPLMVGRWMFGPAVRDEEVVRLDLAPRVGGSFSFVVRRQGDELDHIGEYLEIDRPRRLVFTWGIRQDSGDSSRVIVEVVPSGSGSELTLVHELDPHWAEYAARTEAGWSHMLAKLEEALA